MNDYEKKLGIHTIGEQKGFLKSIHYHRYEPTPYEAIEELLRHYEIKSGDGVVDFGCGKGRLNFLLHYLCDATVSGIEMNELLYNEALNNVKRYKASTKRNVGNIHFHCCLAEEYMIDPRDTIFYFFNPFTIQIFIKVINLIMQSAYEAERTVDTVLYYPSTDYIFYLENETGFELVKEVSVQSIFSDNENERFLIYRLEVSS
ncbi:methyltransferase [Bacillus sp. RD4P76]|uniref:Methyltransferase n=1 Tax=Bacillus suaedaesalsae TaxID=2810349 RepID=A0ABS2DDN2_9BACI|nr:methyltransferase [Bacillus suaedaesalsae]